jgi:hypothetical protein
VAPGAIVDFRTNVLGQPEADGTVFLAYKYTRTLDDIPGITIKLIRNREVVEGDNPFQGSLYWASEARAWLNALSVSRARSGQIAKGFSAEEAQERIERIVRTRGIDGPRGINKLRDSARLLSEQHGWTQEFEKLNRLIATVLATRPGSVDSSTRQRGALLVADTQRVRLFQLLRDALLKLEIEGIHVAKQPPVYRQNLAFFESYFSNFIEGTEFLIDEAKAIVYDNQIIPNRVDDSHDVLGTFRIVSNIAEMQKTPASAGELFDLLKSRHAIILASRQDKHPGQFKEKPNQAGNTLFVLPELVKGTLAEGFNVAVSLTEPLSRAIFIMFVVAEVHPFDDGNGRIARIMMNAELQAGEQMRIIVPTVCREDYVLALKNLSLNAEPAPLIRFLGRLQRFAHSLNFDDLAVAESQFKAANAFAPASDAKLVFG